MGRLCPTSKGMKAKMVTVSREELLKRREKVLAQVGLSAPEFRRKIVAGDLEGDQWAASDEFKEVEFLLNG